MTIDEAIKHCLEVAEEQEKSCEVYGSLKKHQSGLYERLTAENNEKKCAECAAEHKQLAEWLQELKELKAEQNDQYVFINELMRELKEAKRLLKMAVSIINNSFPEVGSCWGCANHDEVNDECKGGAFAECADVCKWQYADEALKLIGEEGEQNAN